MAGDSSICKLRSGKNHDALDGAGLNGLVLQESQARFGNFDIVHIVRLVPHVARSK